MATRSRSFLADPIRPAPRLPADLAKLRERFVADYPELEARAGLLAHVPGGLRHVLGLRMEIDRADALPRHYRELAEAVLRQPLLDERATDAVDLLVIGYCAAVGEADNARAAAGLPALRRYFTDSQIVELTLVLTLARGFAQFDELLESGTMPAPMRA